MGGASEARAEKLRALADEFRRNAGETEMAFYIALMARAAADLEALADAVALRRDEGAPLPRTEPTHCKTADGAGPDAGE